MNTTIAEYFLSFDVFRSFVSRISLWLGTDVTPFIVFMIFLLGALVITLVLATVGGFGTYAERKISADIQARIGPNRVGPYGLFQLIADGIKMVSKEDIAPKTADLFLFYLAPFLAIFGVFSTFAVIPFGSGITLTDLNVGVFYLVAISSLVGVGVFLGGYASNSKWSMLGGMRGASQIISYEIPVTLSILAMVLLSGGMSFAKSLEAKELFRTNGFFFTILFLLSLFLFSSLER